MQRITAYLSSLLFSRRDDGYSTETVIVTALLIAVAGVAVGGISAYVSAQVDSFGAP
ncbi:hypothetical protein [Nocardiopsis dassonvillei]|uniref:hypothetical protein n=1 Tax=Nocardiopsis dassonvillei TaxID=2014 RepID=UPI000B296420|nr:hypothetical protein [Nocardiopsis dassonvillei]MCK9874045.1 hypothetical protein [Nocardiopsis dassonvillei]